MSQTRLPCEWLAISDLSELTRIDYRRAVDRLPDVLGRAGLDATRSWEELKGKLASLSYDPARFSSVAAQKAWIRKVTAAAKGHFGALQTERALRERQDEWAALILSLQNTATCSLAGQSPTLVSQSIIPLRVLSNFARKRGLRPSELTKAVLFQIYTVDAVKDQKLTVVRAAALLDRIRDVEWGNFAAWLPQGPLCFEKPVLSERAKLPQHLDDELLSMTQIASRGTLDPTTGTTFNDIEPSPIYYAGKKVIMTGLAALGTDSRRIESVAEFFEYKSLVAIVQLLQHWQATDDPRAIAAGSMVGYFQRIKPMLVRNGYDDGAVSRIVFETEWLTKGARTRGEMTSGTEQGNRVWLTPLALPLSSH